MLPTHLQMRSWLPSSHTKTISQKFTAAAAHPCPLHQATVHRSHSEATLNKLPLDPAIELAPRQCLQEGQRRGNRRHCLSHEGSKDFSRAKTMRGGGKQCSNAFDKDIGAQGRRHRCSHEAETGFPQLPSSPPHHINHQECMHLAQRADERRRGNQSKVRRPIPKHQQRM